MHCDGFDAQGDLVAWMQAHQRPLAANYINWVGRTVRQVKEESALRRAARREGADARRSHRLRKRSSCGAS